MNERLRPNFWSAHEIARFCETALGHFDAKQCSFGDLINIADLMQLAGIPALSGDPLTVQEYKDRQFIELKLLAPFKDFVLKQRSRCLRQQGVHLRVLHPQEQLDYGEIDHTKAALQKLRRGARIIACTDTNEAQVKNVAIDRLKNVEALIHRQATQRRHPF